MQWLLTRLVGAMVAGIGWKLGADTYEAIKKHVKERSEKKLGEENGAGPTQTHTVEVGGPRGGL
jgi:hypothetical protein